MATSFNSLKLFSVLLFALFIFACGGGGGGDGAPPVPTNFSSSDFSGSWNFLGVSAGGFNEGIVIGTVTLNSSGGITGGSYATSGGTTASFTGGSISISSDQGVVTGSASTNVGVIINVYQGKLNSGKTFASFVDYTNFGEFDLVNLIKIQGSFDQSDLTGTWTILGLSSGGVGEGAFHGTVNLDASGNVTGGSATYLDGISVTYSGGALTINTTGIIGGTVTNTNGAISECLGALDPSKSMGTFGASTRGQFDLVTAIRDGGTFVLGDLDGTWYFSLGASGGANEGVSYGTVIFSSGQVRGGTLRVGNTDVQLTGGTVSISTGGVLSGSVNAANGENITIALGKMNSTKTTLAIVGESNTGNYDFIMAHKGS